MAHCVRHFEEAVEATCRTCHRPFCNRCLVYAFGPNKPPYCVGCALSASGVRNTVKVPVTVPAADADPKKLERAERKQARLRAKQEAKALKRAAKQGGADADPAAEERTSAVPAPKNFATPAASRYGTTAD